MDVRLKIDQETGRVLALMMWHPIGDTWVHVAQIFEDNRIKYLVNGEEIETLPVVPDDILRAIESLKEKDETTTKTLEDITTDGC